MIKLFFSIPGDTRMFSGMDGKELGEHRIPLMDA
jgi:hypothetical protein